MATPPHALAAPTLAEHDRRPPRLASIDILRGLTIALMVLVNDPGDWAHTFAQLDHAAWNGWTLTDTVFPMFLFLVGASTVLSIAARERKGDCRKTLAGHILWRAVKLFLLKTVLSLLPYFHWHTMRVYGVLARIALCYLIAGLILLLTRNVRVLAGIVLAILIGYWALLRFVHIPGCGWPVREVPLLDPFCNLAAWLDRGVSQWMLRWLHTGTLYEKTRDPEGLLSTLPAVATTLLGAMAALWMRRPEWGGGPRIRASMRSAMWAAGAGSLLLGELWGRWFPINKNLWTSSYVLVMAGISTLLLAALSALVDARPVPWPRWLRWCTWPWLVFGANAIVAYAVSVVVVKTCLFIKLHDAAGVSRTLWWLAYHDVFARHGSNNWTSLAFALAVVAICFVPNWLLWRRQIFVKI